MKKYFLPSLLILILLGLYAVYQNSIIKPLYETVTKEYADGMVFTDMAKIVDAKNKLPNIKFDYLDKEFAFPDSINFLEYSKKRFSNTEKRFLFFRFGFNQSQNKESFNDFSFAIEVTNEKGVAIKGNKPILINNFKYGVSDKNYKNASKLLNLKGAIGYKNITKLTGVIYPLSNVIKWLDTHPSSKYYFFPALDNQLSNVIKESSFTTIITTTDKNFRNNIYTNDPKTVTYYADKGQGCCP